MKAQRAKGRSVSELPQPSTPEFEAMRDPNGVALDTLDRASDPLPFLDQISEAFGEHDVSGVSFAGGSDAKAAADGVNAEAFASGEGVAAPGAGLFEVAHEAAHVIQQRGANGPDGVSETVDREAHADEVAAAVTGGDSAAPLLDQVASANAAPSTPGRIERIKDHGSAPPIDVPIASLTESQVLGYIGDIEVNGEVHKPGMRFEYELGDGDKLRAVRDAPGFGAAAVGTLEGVLAAPAAELAAASGARHLDAALIANFQALFAAMKVNAQVVGFGQWSASKMSSVGKLNSGVAAERALGAESLLDCLNELREVEFMLVGLPAAETINIAEAPIAGTTQTADATVSNGRQVEVKTVRKPVMSAAPINHQINEGLKKFAGVAGGAGAGPYDVVVYASWEPTAVVNVNPSADNGGTATEGTQRGRGAGGFTTSFAPNATSKRPASNRVKLLKTEVVAFVDGLGGGATKAHSITVRMENPDLGGVVDNYVFTRAGAAWVAA